MMSTVRPLLIVAGVGNGTGTGAATAREFAKAGYSVALIARGATALQKVVDEINAAGGDAAPFAIAAYDYTSIEAAFASAAAHFRGAPLRAAVFNATHDTRGAFLALTEADVRASLDTNVLTAFAFSRAAVLAMKDLPLDARGKRGTLIFTGATASIRGNTTTAAFAVGKFGLRALSQSLNKEFGKQNIHVAHAIIDGGILTGRSKERHNDPEWENNQDVRLRPESIAQSYLYLANQDRSAWTWELDLRPAHEKW